MRASLALRLFATILALAPASTSLGQLFVGRNGGYAGNVNPNGVTTVIQVGGAYVDGSLTTATFGWSNAPCPGAAKIKFFRPTNLAGDPVGFTLLTERGPFDVTAPFTPLPVGSPPALQTVLLDPPVSVQHRDVIAITNLTSCGGPTFVRELPGPLPPGPGSLAFPGDLTGTVLASSGQLRGGIYLYGVGQSSSTVLLGRFNVSLLATDPRTHQQSVGKPGSLPTSWSSTAAAYFSLPDFTGDPLFPEVVIKMVNPGGYPSLGNSIWFFHAPLTDVEYTITVTDLTDGTVRTYSNTSASPGQLCGGVDTSAFRL